MHFCGTCRARGVRTRTDVMRWSFFSSRARGAKRYAPCSELRKLQQESFLMNIGTVIGIFGAIALGALILGIIWWMRLLDRTRTKRLADKHSTDGVSAAFKRGGTDLPG